MQGAIKGLLSVTLCLAELLDLLLLWKLVNQLSASSFCFLVNQILPLEMMRASKRLSFIYNHQQLFFKCRKGRVCVPTLAHHLGITQTWWRLFTGNKISFSFKSFVPGTQCPHLHPIHPAVKPATMGHHFSRQNIFQWWQSILNSGQEAVSKKTIKKIKQGAQVGKQEKGRQEETETAGQTFPLTYNRWFVCSNWPSNPLGHFHP